MDIAISGTSPALLVQLCSAEYAGIFSFLQFVVYLKRHFPSCSVVLQNLELQSQLNKKALKSRVSYVMLLLFLDLFPLFMKIMLALQLNYLDLFPLFILCCRFSSRLFFRLISFGFRVLCFTLLLIYRTAWYFDFSINF